jgi:hypothetical protein
VVFFFFKKKKKEQCQPSSPDWTLRCQFQTNANRWGVYLNGYEYDGQRPQKPNKLDKVVQRLSQPQTALSSTVSDHDFQVYTDANRLASNKAAVKASVVPLFLTATGSSNKVLPKKKFGSTILPLQQTHWKRRPLKWPSPTTTMALRFNRPTPMSAKR